MISPELKERPMDNSKYNFSLFRQLVRATFNQRRKTILNTLSGAGFFYNSAELDKTANKERTLQVIKEADLLPNARPETLTVDDFINLAIQIERSR